MLPLDYETPAPRRDATGPDSGTGPLDPRFGRVGVVPWTFAQTIIGAAIMLVPWMLFAVGSQLVAGGSAVYTRRLPPAVDAAGGVIGFVFSALVEAAFLLVPAYFVWLRRAPGVRAGDVLRALGFRGARLWPTLGLIVVGIVVVLGASVAYTALISAFHLPLQTNGDTLLNEAKYAPLTTLGLLAAAVLVAPFCEEIFFRGFLFAGLLRGMNVVAAALVAALVFGAAHADLGSFAVLFVIGVVLAIVRWRTGSIWPGMVIHATNNAVAALAILAVIFH